MPPDQPPETREAYDSLAAHLPQAGAVDRAAVPLGMLLGWCASMHLLSEGVVQAHQRLLLRIQVQEARGSELLVALGGIFKPDHLNGQGERFMTVYFPRYYSDFRGVFGPDIYAVDDTWDNYARLAPVLARAFFGQAPARAAGGAEHGIGAKVEQWVDKVRRWWH